MNPPYSAKWSAVEGFKQDERFMDYGGKLAPKSKADYAFLMHGFYHLKPTGTMAIVLPHGVLFRGAAEGAIRETLLKNGSIYAVIGLPSNMFYNTSIPISVFEEQTRIAEFFRNLDHIITHHKHKYDETKELKKYMLQKMFPQNGKKIPEIRFTGFTDDWVQRKLGEITERVIRKNQDLESELPLTISAQYGLIDQNEFFDKRVASKDVSGYYLVRRGEFAYNKSTSSDAPWGTVKRLERYEKGVLSTLYIVFRIVDESKTASDYIVTYYDTDLWHKGVQAIAAEGARNHGLLNITPSDFFETTLMIPKDIDEQNRIGGYFKTLDNLINLHQRKCDQQKKLRNLCYKICSHRKDSVWQN